MVSLDAWSEMREKRKVEEEIGKQKGTSKVGLRIVLG